MTSPELSAELSAAGARVRTVLIAGCLISLVGFGARSVLGLFLEPMTGDLGWSRETFAFALAVQNLMWGLCVPVAGMLADRFGAARVIAFGALLYAGGIAGMALSATPWMLHLSAGLVTGLGVAFTAFSLALAAMARVVGPERRSMALGLGTAAGSLGQVVFSPLGQGFILAFGWQTALLLLAGCTLALLPLAFVLPRTPVAAGGHPGDDPAQTLRAALGEAGRHRGYVLLTTGFFVCGFHVAFITVHFPAYVKDLGLGGSVGAMALALIGLFNIVGSFGSGLYGQTHSKKTGLATIYGLRALVILGLLLAPKTPLVIGLFAAAMGLLWLSTVPLTTGIVGQVFGLRYMNTLFGIVFLSHQLGSFSGVWLGGVLYDAFGTYDPVWWAGVGLSVLAMLLHLPIDERPLRRRPSAAPA
ncbi:MFS transporter [Roseospira navarrensis]|uniref:MFS transporter n=1 Tax=Roseospira navarrensis TaxID=140058 RepID=A0A7X1ZAP0_9PROT|nr:MFS transporter [Roseospira navarrensis]MQX35068.1 MFS transporter [Roseospira navarrensis]